MAEQGKNHLKEIITTLNDYGVRFIICGGVALVLQGIERMTMDIDLAIDMTAHNLRKFLAAMKKLRLKPRAPVPAESLFDPEQRRIFIEEKNALVFTFIDTANPFRQVDIFLTDELSFNALKGDAEQLAISGHTVKLLSKKKLLELKRSIKPLRDKDIFDIQALEKLLQDEEKQQ
jgi:hypothetical protein